MATDPTLPPTTPTPEEIAAVEKYTEAQKKQAETAALANTENTDSIDIFKQIGKYTDDAGNSLANMGNLTGAAALKFGLFATAIAGASEHFKSFTNIDTSRIGSFSNQFKGMMDTVQNSTGFSLASEAGKTLIAKFRDLSGNSKEFQKALDGGGSTLLKFGKQLLTNADNSLRFQAALMQGAAQAGNLNELYKGMGTTFTGIGDHLGNLNQVTSEFQATMSRAMTATGTESVDEIGKFTASLIQIPGGLEAMAKGMDIAGSHTDTLTAIMQMADGAGLDINQTLQDIHKTTTQFKLGIDDSTKFVARFADVSKDLKAQQADVRDALMQTTNAFRMFSMSGIDSAKMTQSVADAVKNYAFSLEQAGVPAQNALEIAKKYTMQFESLTEAQEAFISGQTGGPGGLLGALKFEDLLRQDPAAASAKIAESLKKAMGGTILTKPEAEAKGDFGSEQYMKERLMLTQGVLGIRASSNEEADAMISAMKAGRALPKADADKVMKETMDRGAEKERLSYTGIKEVNMSTETVRLQAGTMVLGGIQTAFSAGAGQETETGRGRNIEGQEILRRAQANAMTPVPGSPTERMEKQTGQTFKDVLPLLTSGFRSINEQFTKAAPLGVTDAQMQANIQARKESSALAPSPPTKTGTPSTTAGHEHTMRSGQQVGAAIRHPTTTATPGTGGTSTTPAFGVSHSGQPVPVTLSPGTVLNVRITGLPRNQHDGTANGQAVFDSPSASTKAPTF